MAQIPKAMVVERSRSGAEKANERASIKNADGPSRSPPTRR